MMPALLREPEVSMMLLPPTRPIVAHAVRSSGDPALAGTRGSDITKNACGKELAIGVANRSEFPVWKTIIVGIYKNVSAMREALDAALAASTLVARPTRSLAGPHSLC